MRKGTSNSHPYPFPLQDETWPAPPPQTLINLPPLSVWMSLVPPSQVHRPSVLEMKILAYFRKIVSPVLRLSAVPSRPQKKSSAHLSMHSKCLKHVHVGEFKSRMRIGYPPTRPRVWIFSWRAENGENTGSSLCYLLPHPIFLIRPVIDICLFRQRQTAQRAMEHLYGLHRHTIQISLEPVRYHLCPESHI
jgi:hypothetical protein